MATAVIINVQGRDSINGVANETTVTGAWDPITIGISGGVNLDYFPAIYSEDFTPGGTDGFFLGHWPDGAGGQFSAIKVNVGFIGGWDIAATSISSANISLVSGVNPVITVGTGDYAIKIGGTAGSEYLGSSTFSSGPLGIGWNIDSVAGRAEFQDIVARGKLSMAVFETTTISSVGGNLLVSNSDVLAVNMTALDASTLTVDGDTTFAVGEVLHLKDGTNDEWMRITAIGSAPTYSVARDLAGSYAADSNPAWTKGSAVVSTNKADGGYIHMDASSANSPYMDIVLRNSATYNDISTKVRLGNLAGITDADFGGALSGYGIYSDNGYFKGNITLANGEFITNISPNQRITINEDEGSGPNNAFLLYIDAGDPIVRIDDNIISGTPGIKVQNPSSVNYVSTVLSVRISATQSGAGDGAVVGVALGTLSEDCIGVSGKYNAGEVADTAGSVYQRIGVVATSIVASGSNTKAIGVFGSALNGGSGGAWAGYFTTGDVYIAEKLGVGIAAPSNLFHVKKSGSAEGIGTFESDNDISVLIKSTFSASAGAGIYLEYDDAFGSAVNGFKAGIITGSTSYSIGYGPLGAFSAGNSFITVLTTGLVGIGTAAPSRPGLNVYNATTPYIHLTNSVTGDGISDGGYIALSNDDMFIGNQETAGGHIYIFVDNDAAKGLLIQENTGNVGVKNVLPLATFDVVGTTRLGDSTTNYVSVEADGDMVFVGGAGLAGGNYGTNSTLSQTIAGTGIPTEVKGALTAGELHNVTKITFVSTAQRLRVAYAGRYKVVWNISFTAGAANQEVEGGVMLNGVAQTLGQAHRKISTGTDTGDMGGNTIVDCAADDELSLYVENQTSTNNINVEHLNMTISQLWGT